MISHLTLAFSLGLLSIHAQPSDDFLGCRVSDLGGHRFIFSLYAHVLARTPSWKQSNDFPPLPPLEARETALKKARELCPFVQEWRADRITLEEIHQNSSTLRTFWIYVVDCEDADGPYSGPPRILQVPVLMDGVVPASKIAFERILTTPEHVKESSPPR